MIHKSFGKKSWVFLEQAGVDMDPSYPHHPPSLLLHPFSSPNPSPPPPPPSLLPTPLSPTPPPSSYFKQNQLYGLSCFERIPVASQEERGARMKSVGLLAVGYSDLHLHMDFLERQVR